MTIRFFDSTNAPQIPDAIRYRIDCESTGRVLQDWTEVDPLAEVSFTIPAQINAIQARANSAELKSLTVECNTGTQNQFTDDFTWRVRNMLGVS